MKYALIIGNDQYDDPKLAQLKTPAADSLALAKVLADKAIGSFDAVNPLINKTEGEIRRAVSSFLINKKPEDLVLVYFSGHGVLDDRGRLFLSLKDTETSLLKATSIPSSFIADEMDGCRSKRQILILDCCHSGAFARGTKGDQKAVTEATFEGSGYGRVVMTATDSTQYALEGDQVISQTDFSLFTHFLLEGLQTGEADMDNDGHVSLDEWYDYTYARVISETPNQVPHKWSYNQQGDLVIARNPNVKKKIVELPYELLQALESPFMGIRESAVTELGKYLRSRDPEVIGLTLAALEKMMGDDSRRISVMAEKLLAEFKQSHSAEIETPLPKPTVDSQPEASAVGSVDSTPSPESKSASKARARQPKIQKTNLPAEEFPLDSITLFKLIGTGMLAILLSIAVYYYYTSINDSGDRLRVTFGLAAGVTGLVQWSLFRERFELWWAAVNAGTGIGLGSSHKYLFENTPWGMDDLRVLLAGWLLINFVLGLILLRRPRNTSSDLSPILEDGARQNLFLLLLSTSLLLGAAANILIIFEGFNYINTVFTLYGISAILAGLLFFLKSGLPRNFGFTTLAVFLLLDGINVERLALDSEYPLYYFTLGAIPAMVSGLFFAFQKETWRNFGFSMLCGYLIMNALAGMTVYDYDLNRIFLGISVIFALPAAFFFLLRKSSVRFG